MDASFGPNIYFGLSTKQDGQMKDNDSNHLIYIKQLGLDDKICVSATLEHGKRVTIVDKVSEKKKIDNCDALITNNKEQLLIITVADCLPIFFYDEVQEVIALAHAGWRGVLANIASEVIKVFKNHYHSDPHNISVYIGPHIKDCHFEVKQDVASKFNEFDIIRRADKLYINLAQIVVRQLVEEDILVNNINISSECSYCLNDKYFSFRRDKPKVLETMLAYIALKS